MFGDEGDQSTLTVAQLSEQVAALKVKPPIDAKQDAYIYVHVVFIFWQLYLSL